MGIGLGSFGCRFNVNLSRGLGIFTSFDGLGVLW